MIAVVTRHAIAWAGYAGVMSSVDVLCFRGGAFDVDLSQFRNDFQPL